jgi:uncharacterized membrane protein
MVTGTPHFGFLILNLLLAWIPALAGAIVHKVDGRGALLVLGVWLAFLPNAPYLVTDLIHLRARSVPLWFDAAMLVTFAGTGLVLGAVSMDLVRERLAGVIGGFGATALVALSTPLVGLGVYLGRFPRWNSWDLATRPDAVLLDIAARVVDPMAHPRTWAVTAVFGALMFATWFAVYGIRAAEPPGRGAK